MPVPRHFNTSATCVQFLPRCQAHAKVGILPPRSGFRLRSTPRSVFRLRFSFRFCPKILRKRCDGERIASGVGFIPKNPSPGQRRRSVSDAVLAVSLTECFFYHLHALPSMLWQQDCCGNRIAPSNSAVATGLPLSILGWAQDCFTHSCADSRIALVHYEQLGLGTVLPEHRLVMESACRAPGPLARR